MKYLPLFVLLFIPFISSTQTDIEKLAIDISNADAANQKQLMDFIWKRHSQVSLDGEVKLEVITEFSFDEEGKLQAKVIDADSDTQQKRGIRGRIQSNAAEAKTEYIQKALGLSVSYTFMSKGELLDFYSSAEVTEKDGLIHATGKNVLVKGDTLTIIVDAATNLFVKKTFKSLLGEDPVSGEINYETFSSGINHGSTTDLNMPAQKMSIHAENKDYSKRVN